MRLSRKISSLALSLALGSIALPARAADSPAGTLPKDKSGRPLNFDFEDGTLRDWNAAGNAFARQPVRGDTVNARRSDMKSQHQGNFWLGGYELVGDDPQGTLTSVPFVVTQPWCSFLFAGGNWPATRVELVRADTQKVFFRISGPESESLRPVVVNLDDHQGKEIFIRLVDEQSGHWGHVNFDHFVFHAARPAFSNALDPAKLATDAPPPADVVKFAGLSPQDAAKETTVPPGFKMHLFAGEPDVKQPIAFSIDERGRMWVAEAYNYPRRAPEGGGKDRILVFEDTDGDHTFDKRTVFMEKLNLISGLEVGFGGVWVGAAPYLMFIPIADGPEPKPAGEPQILLDGWDFKADTHETLNTFIWGPDGWLYGCHGVFCPSFVGKPGTPDNERQRIDAGVWRYHPTKHKFEVFAEGTSNPWGVDFDDYGQCIIEACVIPHFWHMIQGARYERQGGQHYNINAAETRANEKYHANGRQRFINPFIYDDIKTHGDHVHYAGSRGPHAANGRSDAMGGGHAHAGVMIYLADSWPAQYRNKVFMNNIHGQRLNMDILERKGSGYVGKHGPDFINFNDTWSQVLNMRYDQDGSAYIIDWYDKNQCHHNNEDGHDRNNGRIFKLVYNNQKRTAVDLAKKTDDELVQLQLHKNDFYVRQARRLLQERAAANKLAPSVRPALEAIIRDNPDTTRKLRALWALHLTGGLDRKTYVECLKSGEEWVRSWAIHLAYEDEVSLKAAGTGAIAPADEALLNSRLNLKGLAASDNSPLVRRHIYSALQRVPAGERKEVLAALAQKSEDAADHNLPLMAWFAFEPTIEANPAEALALAGESKLPRLLNFTTRRVAAINTPAAFAAITKALSGFNDDQRQNEMLSGLSEALRGRRSAPMPEGWAELEKKLTASANASVRALTLSISLTFGSPSALASLRQTLNDPAADLTARRAALDSLLAARDASLAPSLQALLKDSALRSTALRGLASYDDAGTPAAILGAYSSLSGSEKRDALNTLASRASYAKPLLASIEKGDLSVRELPAELIRQLRNLKDAEIESALTKVYGVARESSADKKAEIERYTRIYRSGGSQPGDAIRGRVVFTKTCQQCHSLFGTGGTVGPDITGANRTDLEYLLQNIIDPNAVIPNEYRSSTITTKDDRSITGIIKSQDANTVTIASANEVLSLPRNEIDTMQQSELSMMPEGLISQLSDQEVRDLIYYLGRPGQVPLMGTADTAGLFFNGHDLTGWEGDESLWKVEGGEIVGKTTTGLKKNEFLKSQMILGDFRLVFKVKLTPNSENSGVQFRSEVLPNGDVKGYQADIGAGWWGKLYEEHGRELLWDKPGDQHVNRDGWNTYEILAVGSRIRTAINGKLCVDLDDPKGAKQGVIAPQLHSGGPMEIRFKDLALEVNPKPELSTVK